MIETLISAAWTGLLGAVAGTLIWLLLATVGGVAVAAVPLVAQFCGWWAALAVVDLLRSDPRW